MLKFYRHFKYIKKEDIWETLTVLLKADRDCIKGQRYLWPHSLEDPSRMCDEVDKKNAAKDRADRELRTEYVNYLKLVVSRLSSLVMRGGIVISDEALELLGDRRYNIDGTKRSIEELMVDLVEDFVSYGVANTLVDRKTAEISSLADEDSTTMPYIQRLPPMSVMDWDVDSEGNYKFIRYEYLATQERKSVIDEPILAKYSPVLSYDGATYTIQLYVSVNSKEAVVNYHPECTIKDDNEHQGWSLVDTASIDGLIAIPFISTGIEDESDLEHVIPIALKIYNKQSELDNILHQQCYDRVFCFTDNGIQLDEDGQPRTDSSKEVRISSNTIVVLPAGGDVKKLAPTNPEALFQSIADDKQDLFLVAFNQSRVIPADSGVGESAEARRANREEIILKLSKVRENIIRVINEAISSFSQMQGQGPINTNSVEFAQQISEDDIEDISLFIRSNIDLITAVDDVRKAVTKKVVSHLNLPNEEELFKSVDASKDLLEEAEGKMRTLTGSMARKRELLKEPDVE